MGSPTCSAPGETAGPSRGPQGAEGATVDWRLVRWWYRWALLRWFGQFTSGCETVLLCQTRVSVLKDSRT